MKVFYLENEEMLQKVMEDVFQQSEHEIYTRNSLGEWKYLIDDLAPDLLLLDLEAMELSEEVSFEDVYATQIPIAVIKRVHGLVDENLLNHSSLSFICEKPFSPIELLEKIEKFFVSH